MPFDHRRVTYQQCGKLAKIIPSALRIQSRGLFPGINKNVLIVVNSKSFFSQDVLNYIKTAMNFTVRHEIPADGQFGAMKKDGSWSGMIGMLVKREADVSASALSINVPRSQAVDFVQPVYR